ncbi:MAG TPA: hypothetical protein PLY77_03410 [Plasticicumulans sp.]|uniref:hypothetical protein n=1 Tax=Plasticicumulans sp. TaxID=2307179 RepID=UPI002BAE4711|nr:hypothetical protein [Plasticicumulans sp.]
MIVCDTHVLLFDALQPERLSAAARQALDAGEAGRELMLAIEPDGSAVRHLLGSVREDRHRAAGLALNLAMEAGRD